MACPWRYPRCRTRLSRAQQSDLMVTLGRFAAVWTKGRDCASRAPRVATSRASSNCPAHGGIGKAVLRESLHVGGTFAAAAVATASRCTRSALEFAAVAQHAAELRARSSASSLEAARYRLLQTADARICRARSYFAKSVVSLSERSPYGTSPSGWVLVTGQPAFGGSERVDNGHRAGTGHSRIRRRQHLRRNS